MRIPVEHGQKVKDVLERARGKIDPRERWIKGQGFGLLAGEEGEPVHCYCLGAAIDAGTHDVLLQQSIKERELTISAWVEAPMQHMLASIKRHVPKPATNDEWKTVVHFNDHPDTTHEDVMRVLGHAIEEADEGVFDPAASLAAVELDSEIGGKVGFGYE